MGMQAALAAIQDDLRDLPCRVLPTSFDADDPELLGFPLPSTTRWNSLAIALQEFRPRGVMLRLPLFWQIEVLAWYAARSANCPIFLCDPENMPLSAAALVRGGIDTIITEARDAALFSTFLDVHRETRPRQWMIVHRATDPWVLPEGIRERSRHEVHLVPGLPIFTQCEHASRLSGPLKFHQSDYVYDPVSATITTQAHDTIPRFSLPISTAVSSHGTCACGNALYGYRS